MEDKLYDIILSKELTWEGLIRDIVKEENMDPWNINISNLTTRYLDHIKNLKRIDFKLTATRYITMMRIIYRSLKKRCNVSWLIVL